jgi:DNA polymerase (family 10)
VIDACAANEVIIEINANPWRLDIDWHWLPYALNKGVLISINPDAHEKAGYHDMQYGVHVARKGGLPADMTFNAWPLERVEAYLKAKQG